MLLAVLPLVTHADIYKCIDEDGNVAYLQLPCPEEAAESADVNNDPDPAFDEQERQADVNDSSAAPENPPSQPPSSRRPGESLDDCKKRYRDQIDAIDAEMRVSYSSGQSDIYMEKLLALTAQLRACG